MANLCSNEHSKMSFELLETIQATQNELPPKLASMILKTAEKNYDVNQKSLKLPLQMIQGTVCVKTFVINLLTLLVQTVLCSEDSLEHVDNLL